MTTPRFRTFPLLMSTRLALVLACATPALLHAGALNVSFTDAAGAPLVDAVALLEPASGKVAVKPMPDAEISPSSRRRWR